jgi:hypothetical protein
MNPPYVEILTSVDPLVLFHWRGNKDGVRERIYNREILKLYKKMTKHQTHKNIK